MQINLHNNALKKSFLYLGWVLFFFCLWLKGCSSENSKHEFSKPIKKTFERVITLQKEIPHFANKKQLTIFVKSNSDKKYINELEDKLFKLQYQNDSLKNNFISLPDTIKVIEYNKAIQLKLFEKTFEDNYFIGQVNGVVQGDVKDLGFSYEIKKQPLPITKFRLIAGVGIANTIHLDKLLFNANLGFQNAKGNILRIGYDSESRIFVGYDFSVFKLIK